MGASVRKTKRRLPFISMKNKHYQKSHEISQGISYWIVIIIRLTYETRRYFYAKRSCKFIVEACTKWG